ncbi:MAG: hypothetical protein P9M13_01035 [Candidatus Ancaeobacter aquaticus]|nr:hypothetical protein [Candidatus Ancaeobacter aquaticus]
MKKLSLIIISIVSLLIINSVTNTSSAQDETETKSISIGFMEADNALTLARSLLSPKGVAVFNRSNNTVIIVDYPKNITTIEKLFKNQPRPINVRIEVRFRDKTQKDTSILGFGVRSTSGDRSGIQHITTISGSVAYINVGTEVAEPYWFYEYGYRYGYIVTGTVWRDVGSRLLVKPVVSGNIVKVSLIPEISYFDGKRKRRIQYKNASTTVMCASGQSIQIGGVSQSKDRNVREFWFNFMRNQKNQSFSLVLTPYILKK